MVTKKEIDTKIQDILRNLNDTTKLPAILNEFIDVAVYYKHQNAIDWAQREITAYEDKQYIPPYRAISYVKEARGEQQQVGTHLLQKNIAQIIEQSRLNRSTLIATANGNTYKMLINRSELLKIIDGVKAKIREYLIKLQKNPKTVDICFTTPQETEEKLAFDWSDLHPEIVNVVRKLFEGGHYAEAVEAGFKEINDQVKIIVRQVTGEEYDGADLMQKAFRDESPIITLADLSNESGENIQKGYRFIFAGTMTGIRNPCAHANLNIEKVDAFHKIVMASDLMCVLSNRISPPIKDAKCSLCGQLFTKQGLKTHMRTCQKRQAPIVKP